MQYKEKNSWQGNGRTAAALALMAWVLLSAPNGISSRLLAMGSKSTLIPGKVRRYFC